MTDRKTRKTNAMVLGKAATPAQLSELALFDCTVAVMHYRPIELPDSPDNRLHKGWGTGRDLANWRMSVPNARFSPTGGTTQVTIKRDDGSVVVGAARCSEEDQFFRRRSVEIALGRAMKQLPGNSNAPEPEAEGKPEASAKIPLSRVKEVLIRGGGWHDVKPGTLKIRNGQPMYRGAGVGVVTFTTTMGRKIVVPLPHLFAIEIDE